MSEKMKNDLWLGISIFGFLAMSVSFVLMPLESAIQVNNVSIYVLIAGLVFWVSLVIGIVGQAMLTWRRNRWHKKNPKKRCRLQRRIGLITFFSNFLALIADVLCGISLIALIVLLMVTNGAGFICYILLALFTFAFSMHCILNGKNYYFVINQEGPEKVGPGREVGKND